MAVECSQNENQSSLHGKQVPALSHLPSFPFPYHQSQLLIFSTLNSLDFQIYQQELGKGWWRGLGVRKRNSYIPGQQSVMVQKTIQMQWVVGNQREQNYVMLLTETFNLRSTAASFFFDKSQFFVLINFKDFILSLSIINFFSVCVFPSFFFF